MFDPFSVAVVDVGGGAFAFLFEEIAEGFVEGAHFVGLAHAEAVGRIADDGTAFRDGDLSEIGDAAGDLFASWQAVAIHAGKVDRLLISIAAVKKTIRN